MDEINKTLDAIVEGLVCGSWESIERFKQILIQLYLHFKDMSHSTIEDRLRKGISKKPFTIIQR